MYRWSEGHALGWQGLGEAFVEKATDATVLMGISRVRGALVPTGLRLPSTKEYLREEQRRREREREGCVRTSVNIE